MAYRKVENENLTAIADVIRETYDIDGMLRFPDEFVDAIKSSNTINFYVVNGTAQPESPNENTLWVNTDIEITTWEFSAEQPTVAVEGMVWFKNSTTSTTEFNAIKQNELYMCPTACSQYINGNWVTKSALVYMNGEWINWILYVFKDGVIHDGTLVIPNSSQNNATVDESTIHVWSVNNTAGNIYFSVPVDLTPYNTLYYVGSMTVRQSGDIYASTKFGVFKTTSSEPTAYIGYSLSSDTYSIDISELSGEYYIGFRLKGPAAWTEAWVSSIYLE